MSPNFLAFIGVLLNIEQAVLYVAAAQAAVVALLVVALVLARILAFFRGLDGGDRA